MNYHLVKQKQQRIKNLEKDLDNGLVYLHLLHSIDPETCSTDGLEEQFSVDRAGFVMKNVQALGLTDIASSKDLMVGD